MTKFVHAKSPVATLALVNLEPLCKCLDEKF